MNAILQKETHYVESYDDGTREQEEGSSILFGKLNISCSPVLTMSRHQLTLTYIH